MNGIGAICISYAVGIGRGLDKTEGLGQSTLHLSHLQLHRSDDICVQWL